VTKRNAMKWVNALRSGEYKQGDRFLLKDGCGGYCCLGVLDDLFSDLDLRGSSSSVLRNFDKIGLNSCEATLPGSYVTLAELNDGSSDGERFTFDEIADIIQAQYVEPNQF
jgi:hypothetical protein